MTLDPQPHVIDISHADNPAPVEDRAGVNGLEPLKALRDWATTHLEDAVDAACVTIHAMRQPLRTITELPYRAFGSGCRLCQGGHDNALGVGSWPCINGSGRDCFEELL